MYCWWSDFGYGKLHLCLCLCIIIDACGFIKCHLLHIFTQKKIHTFTFDVHISYLMQGMHYFLFFILYVWHTKEYKIATSIYYIHRLIIPYFPSYLLGELIKKPKSVCLCVCACMCVRYVCITICVRYW